MTETGTDAPEGGNKQLNRMVGVTVVALAVFLGLCHIKDENLVQAMQQAQSDAVDAWNEYQATKIKLHISQDTLITLDAMAAGRGGAGALAAKRVALADDVAKYAQEATQLQSKAKGFSKKYDQLNFHDDQFDMCDAFVGIAISAAAVAALAEGFWVLAAAWVFAAFGVLMGLSGFLGWSIHPDALANFLS